MNNQNKNLAERGIPAAEAGERKEKRSELVFILDRSGSMSGLEGDTIGGFNALIEKQKKEPGSCLVTTVLFDSRAETIHDRVELQEIRPMTERDYTVGGCTALLDALGDAIRRIARIHSRTRREELPDSTTFVIMTDGMENASRFYSSGEVKDMIRHEKEKYGWEFLFLAANIDAVETAARMGIRPDRAVNYRADGQGTRIAYEAVCSAVSVQRACRPLSADWSRSVNEDCENR